MQNDSDSKQNALYSKANTFHVSIRNNNKTIQQNQIRQKNKQFMKAIYRKIIAEDLSPDSIVSMLLDNQKSVQLETWIIETGYEHALFQQFMNVNTLQGRCIVLKGIIDILEKSLKSCSRLLEDSKYVQFLFNQFKSFQYSNVKFSIEYLDHILETIACLTCIQNLDFNFYLHDMRIVEFIGNKIRTQFQNNFNLYDSAKMKNRVRILLVIMENLFYIQNSEQVQTLFSSVIKQLSNHSQFYKICPVNLLAVFRQIFNFNCNYQQKITNFFTQYYTSSISHLQQYYHQIDINQEKQLTIQILRIIPIILINGMISQKDIFKNQEQLFQLYLNMLSESDNQIRKIAWGEMQTIIMYLRPSLISKDSHVLNCLLNTLLKQLNSESNQIQECIQCLNSLIIFQLSDNQVFDSAISKDIIKLASNLISSLDDQQLLNQIIILLHRIVIYGEKTHNSSLFQLFRQSKLQQNIQTTIFYRGKDSSKLAQQLYTKIQECLHTFQQ